MGVLYDALESLSPVHDAEILDGYRRYEAQLATILTPEQLAIYADYIQQTDVVRIFDEMTADELYNLPPGLPAVAAAILADTDISMENRRVVALLNQRGETEHTPDFNAVPENSVSENSMREGMVEPVRVYDSPFRSI
jgi:hypothetical protein